MDIDPYSHSHTHVEEITWSRLGGFLIELTETISRDWRPEIVVGIAKGGLIPAVYISSAFQVDLFPIKLSSRHNEKIVYKEPVWFVYPTEIVRGKKVLLVDDISAAGRTLKIASEKLKNLGATEIRTATIAAHKESPRPAYVVLVTDALIVWPWDRDVLSEEGTWEINPEYLDKMEKISGYDPGSSPAREPEGRWFKQ